MSSFFHCDGYNFKQSEKKQEIVRSEIKKQDLHLNVITDCGHVVNVMV
jgi:hypothetical protein